MPKIVDASLKMFFLDLFFVFHDFGAYFTRRISNLVFWCCLLIGWSMYLIYDVLASYLCDTLIPSRYPSQVLCPNQSHWEYDLRFISQQIIKIITLLRLSFFLFFTKKDDLIRHYHLIYKPDEITSQQCQYLCGCCLYRTWLGYPCIIRIIDCKCRIIILLYLSLHLSQRGSSGKLDTRLPAYWMSQRGSSVKLDTRLHACWVNLWTMLKNGWNKSWLVNIIIIIII